MEKNNSIKGIITAFLFAIVVGGGVFFITKSLIKSSISGVGILIVIFIFITLRKKLKIYQDLKKMEDSFPDFIQLMSSNLRAGMTTDKALLLSSRKEFYPLDTEILKLGKEIITGKEIDLALQTMSLRINSEKIKRTLNLIISGIRSGGNLATLLEQTAANMRERNFIEKRSASNVLMYVIFIFFAVAIGAPVLFGLSAVLVEVLTNLFANIPAIETSTQVPFTLSKISISIDFITYFSIVFIVVTDILASLVIGLVNKGEEKEGLKYMIPLIIISLVSFFIVRFMLLNYFSGLFG